MQNSVKILSVLCFWVFSTLCAQAQTQVSKTIIVETVPDGAEVHIKYHKNGDVFQQKICSSPCVFDSNLDRLYYVEIKKPNYANYSFNSNLSFYTHQRMHFNVGFLEDKGENIDWFQYKQTNNIDEYKVFLETVKQKDFRESQLELGRAKKRLAKKCPNISDKHYLTGDRLARPCNLNPTRLLNKDKCSFKFDVRASGFIENIREVSCILPSNEETLNEVNVIDSDRWLYFPEIKNGRAIKSTGLIFSTDFLTNDPKFACAEKMAKYESLLSHDAIPCIIEKPQYPKKLKGKHQCEVMFDVSASGETKNIKTRKCSHKRTINPTIESVERWIYIPKKVNGTPVGRVGVINNIKFSKP